MNKQLVDLCGCVMLMADKSPVYSTKQEVGLLVLKNITALSCYSAESFTYLW